MNLRLTHQRASRKVQSVEAWRTVSPILSLKMPANWGHVRRCKPFLNIRKDGCEIGFQMDIKKRFAFPESSWNCQVHEHSRTAHFFRHTAVFILSPFFCPPWTFISKPWIHGGSILADLVISEKRNGQTEIRTDLVFPSINSTRPPLWSEFTWESRWRDRIKIYVLRFRVSLYIQRLRCMFWNVACLRAGTK